jgi:oligosaccharyltransferase complex subunit alpha (ribophorin I)
VSDGCVPCYHIESKRLTHRKLNCNRDVHVHTPFKVDSIEHSIHKTYLDSTGRPKVTLKKKGCTERHDRFFYVSAVAISFPTLRRPTRPDDRRSSTKVTYTYPFYAILQKPIAIALACGGLFGLAGVLRRVDTRLSKAVKTQ